MNSTDLITMIGNLSRSLYNVQHFLSGFAYLIGIVFIMIGLAKLKAFGGRNSQEKMLGPVAFLMGGAILLFLPSAVNVLSNTTFGSGNILSYAKYSPYDIYTSMGLVIQTAGLIWFIRGCVLLISASDPSTKKHGSKGLVFLCAGVLAMNFQTTAAALNTIMEHLESLTLTIKSSQGY